LVNKLCVLFVPMRKHYIRFPFFGMTVPLQFLKARKLTRQTKTDPYV